MSDMLGLIIPVPKEISFTGYIRIVADNSKCKGNDHYKKWDYIGVPHDLDTDYIYNEGAVYCTKDQITAWLRDRPKESVETNLAPK